MTKKILLVEFSERITEQEVNELAEHIKAAFIVEDIKKQSLYILDKGYRKLEQKSVRVSVEKLAKFLFQIQNCGDWNKLTSEEQIVCLVEAKMIKTTLESGELWEEGK